jgi:Pyruvate/2-oxoglutarate dehydrogenase complex, dehydrogenase (E1) component, eukaryotic type, beta subunit
MGRCYTWRARAADELAKAGVEAEIIDPRTIKPLDLPMILESVRKTNRCVIVDEAHPFAGTAAEIGFLIQREAFDHLDAPVLRVTLPDTPAPFARNLFDAWLPSPKNVIDAVNAVTYR